MRRYSTRRIVLISCYVGDLDKLMSLPYGEHALSELYGGPSEWLPRYSPIMERDTGAFGLQESDRETDSPRGLDWLAAAVNGRSQMPWSPSTPFLTLLAGPYCLAVRSVERQRR